MNISPSITQSKLIILTGAGASVPLGKFTTREFLQNFPGPAIARAEQLAPGAGDLLRQVIQGSRPTNYDIEVILAQFEARAEAADRLAGDALFMSQVLGERQGLIHPYRSQYLAMRDAIYDEVIRHYGDIDTAKAADLCRPLLEFARQWFATIDFDIRTLPIFTLNYDLAVESAASHLAVRLVDGITTIPGKTERRWSRNVFGEYAELEQDLSVVLIKLHGSVRLGLDSRARPEVRHNELIELPPHLTRDAEPYQHVVLYPSLAPKPIAMEPFHTHYRVFNACLSRATLLVVIGCSLRDPEVQIAIRAGIEDNPSLRVLVIDPAGHHTAVAQLLQVDEGRIAAVRQELRIEDVQYLRSGKSELMACIRGHLAEALGVQQMSHAFPFGNTYDAMTRLPVTPGLSYHTPSGDYVDQAGRRWPTSLAAAPATGQRHAWNFTWDRDHPDIGDHWPVTENPEWVDVLVGKEDIGKGTYWALLVRVPAREAAGERKAVVARALQLAGLRA